jgi:DHA1 family bicyclomycin/chloramphenicol resistance-like MFS transporter
MQSERARSAGEEVSGLDPGLVPTLMLATFVNFLGSLALGPFLPNIADELGTSVALVGQVPALLMLVAAGLGLVVGPLADQFGYRRMLLIGLLTVVASTLATGLAPSFPLLLTVALVGAVGRAAVQPTAQAIVAGRFADEAARRVAMSRVVIGQSGAAIVGIPLLTFIAALSGWRLAFFALAGLALLITAVGWRVLPGDPRAANATFGLKSVLAGYLTLLRHRASVGLIAAALVGIRGSGSSGATWRPSW